MRPGFLLAIVVALAGCAAEPDSSTSDAGAGSSSAAGGSSSITPTEYATSLTFLSGEAGAPEALVLQVANFASRGSLERRYAGWAFERSAWRSLIESEYRDSQTRAPWRVFPTDSLRMVVNEDGESELIKLRGASAGYSLEIAERLDSWEDRSGARHEIRLASLESRGRRRSGVIVQQRFSVPRPPQPVAFSAYERAVLTSEDGAIIILFNTRTPEIYGDAFAWMYAEGLTRRWLELEARTVEVVNSAELRRNIPVRFWFRIPEPDIRCELRAEARAVRELPTETGPKPYNAIYKVSGWIEFAGERLTVKGTVERGEP